MNDDGKYIYMCVHGSVFPTHDVSSVANDLVEGLAHRLPLRGGPGCVVWRVITSAVWRFATWLRVLHIVHISVEDPDA